MRRAGLLQPVAPGNPQRGCPSSCCLSINIRSQELGWHAADNRPRRDVPIYQRSRCHHGAFTDGYARSGNHCRRRAEPGTTFYANRCGVALSGGLPLGGEHLMTSGYQRYPRRYVHALADDDISIPPNDEHLMPNPGVLAYHKPAGQMEPYAGGNAHIRTKFGTTPSQQQALQWEAPGRWQDHRDQMIDM